MFPILDSDSASVTRVVLLVLASFVVAYWVRGGLFADRTRKFGRPPLFVG